MTKRVIVVDPGLANLYTAVEYNGTITNSCILRLLMDCKSNYAMEQATGVHIQSSITSIV